MRSEALINGGWKFIYGDAAGAEARGFDDSEWYDVGLPHSFSIPYFMENEFYVGYGCYRRRLTLSAEQLAGEVSLRFGAVFQHAAVYVNGELAGSHNGGYTAFEVKPGVLWHEGENVIFVRVDNIWDARLAPRSGEHVFSGGIYRDVSLLVTDALHIATDGIFVTTPEVSGEAARVHVSAEIANDGGSDAGYTLRMSVEYGGAVVAEPNEVSGSVAAGGCDTVCAECALPSPRLWSPDTPELYRLVARVYSDGALRDEYAVSFGVRTIRFDKEEGFFLNGVHTRIMGANVHQDHAGWGDAITHTAVRRDVAMIKDCGMNFIRGSHYPHNRVFAEACDELGLMFWSELCYWGTGGPNREGYWTASAYPPREEDRAAFEQSCLDTLAEMIRQNRNSPSIVVWSMCNEPFFSDFDLQKPACELARRLVERSHELDPSRPAALGGVQRGKFDLIGDVAGYNGDGAALYKHPDVPNLVTEYGSVNADRPGRFEASYGELEADVTPDYPWRCGIVLWCAFHHGSILGDMGHLGMIDYARLPLRAWYWYRRELLSIEPPPEHIAGTPHALRLTADKTRILADGTDDAFITITLVDAEGRALNNPASVTLSVTEGAGLLPTGRSMTFSVENGRFLDGEGAVEFRTYYGGDSVLSAESDGVLSASVTITGCGADAWDGSERRLPPPPPYKSAMPGVPRGELISARRPVFCSGAAEGFPASAATEEGDAVWRAPSENASWLMVDLEGVNSVGAVQVELDGDCGGYALSFSTDGREYHPINVTYTDGAAVRASLTPTPMRFVRVAFTGGRAGVRAMRIYG